MKFQDGDTDWGWSVVVNVVKRPPPLLGTLPTQSNYIVHVLLHCSVVVNENGSHPKPYPPKAGEKGEMHVTS